MDAQNKIKRLQVCLDNALDYLSPLLLLANCHTVEFITDNLWEKRIPEKIRMECEEMGIESVVFRFWNNSPSELTRFARKAEKYIIENSEFFTPIESLGEALKIGNDEPRIIVTDYMNNKKSYEVAVMSNIVSNMATFSEPSVVIDIGCGKGYLSSILALRHHLQILAIDSKITNIEGAIRTTKQIEKKWDLYEQKAGIKKAPTNTRRRQTATVIGNAYKQRVENISSETNLRSIICEEFRNESPENAMLIGLHLCGNLASDCLELCVNSQRTIKSVMIVGCCYHLIDEEFTTDALFHREKSRSVNTGHYGFPMSAHLKMRQFSLGRDARMCGTQNPSRVFKENKLTEATKPLFYRALLQQLLIQKCHPDNFPQRSVGRMAHKCDSFTEYATKALRKLDVNIRLEPNELEEFERIHELFWQRLKIFFLLKTCLSSVIETVILLDRLLYLYENDATGAFITRIFDPIISPRCYALTVIK